MVAVKVTRWKTTRGVREVESELVENYLVSMQPMNSARMQAAGIEAGVTAWVVYFTTDPEVNAGDVIETLTKTLAVLAPAKDEAGRGVVWSVDCREIS